MSSDQTPQMSAVPLHIVPQGPVLTEELFNKVVATVEYHLFDGTTTVACALKLRNGFTITGYAASMPTGRFVPELGMQYSMEDAKKKLGEAMSLLVYDLCCPEQFRVASDVQSILNALKESANG